MNNLENIFGKKPVIPTVKIGNAEFAIKAGFEYFCGKEYQWLPCYDKVVSWASDNKNKGLLMYGDFGTGKTTLASRILLPLINNYWRTLGFVGNDDRYWLRRFTMDKIKEAYDCNSSLVLEDLGTESAMQSEYGQSNDYFARIADKAEYEGKLLICTTNLNSDELKKVFGDRTFERLGATMLPVGFHNTKSLRR